MKAALGIAIVVACTQWVVGWELVTVLVVFGL